MILESLKDLAHLVNNPESQLLKQQMIDELKDDALDRPESFGRSLLIICKSINFLEDVKKGVKEYAFQYLLNNQEVFEDENLKIQPMTTKTYLYDEFTTHPNFGEYEGLKLAIEQDKQRMQEIEKDMKNSTELPFKPTNTIKVLNK